MLKALIRFSLDYASLVLIAAVLITAYAIYSLPSMTADDWYDTAVDLDSDPI